MGHSPSVEQIRTNLKEKPTVCIVGAGAGGCAIAKRLDKSVNVVLIDRRNHFFHNVGALRPVVEVETAYKMCIPYDRLLQVGAFIQGQVTKITDKEVTLQGIDEPIKFDYVIIATGSSYAFPMKNQLSLAADVPKVYQECNAFVQNAEQIVIVGGGPVGIELLGEIGYKYPSKKVTLFQSGPDILPGATLKQKLRTSVLTRIKNNFPNCTVLTGERVKMSDSMKEELAAQAKNNKAYLTGKRDIESEKGTKITADLVFFATGTRLNSSTYSEFFKDSINPENGRLICEPTMQVKGYTNVFALGDCADMGPQLAALAGDYGQAPIVENNVLRTIEGNKNKLKMWQVPKTGMMLVPLGPNQGAGQLPFMGGKVVGAGVTKNLKSKGLFYSQNWSLLGYQNMQTTITTQTGKEINASLNDEDVSRLAAGCKLDEAKFKQLLEGAAAPAYQGIELNIPEITNPAPTVNDVNDANDANAESKENDAAAATDAAAAATSGAVEEENTNPADDAANTSAAATMASAASEATEATEATDAPADAPVDEPVEAPAEAPAETPAETTTEADAPADAPAEAPAEVQAEEPAAADATDATDAAADAPAEAQADAADDAANAPADAPADAPAEADVEPAAEPVADSADAAQEPQVAAGDEAGDEAGDTQPAGNGAAPETEAAKDA